MNARLILFLFITPIVLMYLAALLYRTNTQDSVSEFLGLLSKLFSFLGYAVWLLGVAFGISIIIEDDFANWYYGLLFLGAYAYTFYAWRKYTMKINKSTNQIEQKDKDN